MEIERKFLLNIEDLPFSFDELKGEKIIQSYLLLGDGGDEVRIRKKKGKHTLTIKKGSGLVRKETEIELTPEQFTTLYTSDSYPTLEKVRYVIPYEGYEIEIDCYGGHLDGLLVAEVEFSSEKEALDFIVPPWFGEEKTHDHEFRNSVLACSLWQSPR